MNLKLWGAALAAATVGIALVGAAWRGRGTSPTTSPTTSTRTRTPYVITHATSRVAGTGGI